ATSKTRSRPCAISSARRMARKGSRPLSRNDGQRGSALAEPGVLGEARAKPAPILLDNRARNRSGWRMEVVARNTALAQFGRTKLCRSMQMGIFEAFFQILSILSNQPRGPEYGDPNDEVAADRENRYRQ